jgi:undecaprenyl phosphate-alpha-L-ara4FN deformylase
MKIALKIDVDTLRGTRRGVLSLARLLADNGQRATFFFSVGPDNMGRHLFRLLKPAFLLKMLKSNAPGLYGWDILLKGTLCPGPRIAPRCADVFRETAAMGHETGLHAWDHHGWQAHAVAKGEPYVRAQMQKGLDALSAILGAPVGASATPGWQADGATLRAKAAFPSLRYGSDCRGTSLFRPVVDGLALAQPQLPTTLPTYDELIGRNGITAANYNDRLLALLRPGALNVLCIHAEAEGIACFDLFRDFLARAIAAGHTFRALADFLPPDPAAAPIPLGRLELEGTPGREGVLGVQRPFDGLAFRLLAPSDCRMIHEWANDPALLAHSFRTREPIPYETHEKWFAKTLAGDVRWQYVALLPDGSPAGHVRFEENHLGETEISVYLAPSARGKRLSKALIEEGTRLHLARHPAASRPVTAWVRVENAPSLGAFRAAGWRESAPSTYLDLPAIRFVCPSA